MPGSFGLFVCFSYLLPVDEEDERVGPGPAAAAGLWVVGRHAAVRCVLRAFSRANVRAPQRTGQRIRAGACLAAGSGAFQSA